MAIYTIKELSILSKIKPHTIRIWEQRYQILEPHRTESNFRAYTDQEAKYLIRVAGLNQHGRKISQLVGKNDEDIAQDFENLIRTASDNELFIQALFIDMMNLDEPNFKSHLELAEVKFGFENAVENVFFPFVARSGKVWKKGNAHSSFEHFAHSLIRTNMVKAVDGISLSAENPNPKKFVLFLPDNEFHDLVLIYSNYIIKNSGHRAIYLGGSVQVDNLIQVATENQVDYVFANIHNTSTKKRLQTYFTRLTKNLNGISFLASGIGAEKILSGINSEVQIISSRAELLEQLDPTLRSRAC